MSYKPISLFIIMICIYPLTLIPILGRGGNWDDGYNFESNETRRKRELNEETNRRRMLQEQRQREIIARMNRIRELQLQITHEPNDDRKKILIGQMEQVFPHNRT